MRLKTGYLDRRAGSLDDALAIIDDAKRSGEAVSVGLLGNCAEVLPELVKRGVKPDAVTDQTSAPDPLTGYLPAGWTLEQWGREKSANPQQVIAAATQSLAVPDRALLAFHNDALPTFDYRNTPHQAASAKGVADAYD